MARFAVRVCLPLSLCLTCGLSVKSVSAASSLDLPRPAPSAVASGTVDLFFLAGGSLYGPSLGLKTRFSNGFEVGFRHAQWEDGYAQDAGLYFMVSPDLSRDRRLYMGTEYFRSNATTYALGGKADKPAMLFVLGQEHRLGGRLALSYEGAGGLRLTRNYVGLLPPMVMQGRVQFLCRLM